MHFRQIDCADHRIEPGETELEQKWVVDGIGTYDLEPALGRSTRLGHFVSVARNE